ncbi:MAG: efflux RND transporter permease subunit, partial [Alphaproteobacteria bacterium]
EAADRLKELIGEIPDAEQIDVNYSINNPDPDLEFSVNAPELDTLQAAADDLVAQLRTYEAVYDVRNNLRNSTEEVRFVLKPGAQKLGLTLAEVTRQARQAYFGEEVQRLPRGGGDVRVMVHYPKADRRSLDSLANFRIRTPDGKEVPLQAIADIEFAPGIQRIERRERQRSTVVSADLTDEVRDQITKDLNENFFPEWEKRYPGVSRGAIGQAQGQAQFISEILTLYTLAFIAMYVLIAIAFHSYWLPIIILSAIPFSFMGAVFGHMMFGMNLTIWSYFGIGAAVGVVINDNLVLVDYIHRLNDKGAELRRAIVEAGVVRFRPILLTSVTTFIGLVPMMIERAIAAQFLKPTVVALAFGVMFALFVTLLLVPALYSISMDLRVQVDRLKAFLARYWR